MLDTAIGNNKLKNFHAALLNKLRGPVGADAHGPSLAEFDSANMWVDEVIDGQEQSARALLTELGL